MDRIGPPSNVDAEIEGLNRSRDNAVMAARAAVFDASRLSRLLTVLNEPAATDCLLDDILNTISETFSADLVVLIDAAGTGHFHPVASVGMPEDFVLNDAALAEISQLFETHLEACVLTPEVIRATSALDELGQTLMLKTAVWIPIKGHQESSGALVLARCASLAFKREEIGMLSTMAYRIAGTLEQIRGKIQLERIIRGNREIIGHQMQRSAMEEDAVRAFPVILGADAAILFSCFGDYRILCHSGADTIRPDAPAWALLAQRLSADPAIRRGESISEVDGRRSRLYRNSCDLPYATVLASPVFREGRLENLICALRANAVDFPEETRQMATLYSGHLGSALENAQLYGALRNELQERMAIESALRESEERFKALVRNITDVIVVLDSEGEITYAGDAARSQWGLAPEKLVGNRLLDRVHPEDVKSITALIADVLKKPTQNSRAVARLRNDATDDWRYFDVILSNLLHDGAVNGIVSTFHDVTERKVYELELSKLAFRDPLTGLANRANFCDRVRFALARADERNAAEVLVFIDLDNFKYVNDTFGHAAGDVALRTVADRVLGCLRTNDTAARLGGDEFTVLIEHIKDIEHSLPIIERLMTVLMEPIWLNGTNVTVGASIGVAVSLPNEEDVESLMRKADLAMYRAKRSGKGCYVIFDPTIDT